MLKTEGTDQGTNELGQNIKIVFYELDQEKQMLLDAFKIKNNDKFFNTMFIFNYNIYKIKKIYIYKY